MGSVEIIILVVSILAGIYLLLVLVGVLFIYAFSRIFRKHNAALGVMLHTKYDNIKKMLDIMNKYNINVPYKYIETINGINVSSFKDQQLEECVKGRNSLSYLRNELAYMASSNELINKNNELIRAMNAITEMDSNYRTLVAMYNADVLGYNYWINYLPTKYFKYIFKFKEKQIIS